GTTDARCCGASNARDSRPPTRRDAPTCSGEARTALLSTASRSWPIATRSSRQARWPSRRSRRRSATSTTPRSSCSPRCCTPRGDAGRAREEGEHPLEEEPALGGVERELVLMAERRVVVGREEQRLDLDAALAEGETADATRQRRLLRRILEHAVLRRQ